MIHRLGGGAAIALLPLLGLAACGDDGLESVQRAAAVRLGATSTSEGIVVSVPECFGYGDHVDALIVYRADLTVWRIEAADDGGAELGDVVVGKAPPGFREVVPFERRALDGLVHVSVAGSLDGGRGAPVAMASFQVDDLADEPVEGGCGDE